MTTSLVAVVTDVVRDGKRVVGYGFNSNGRYGQGGLIRERFAPRIMEADPKSLLDDAGDNLDPDRIWAAMMKNEKPGGHGERSVAVGTIDMAVWDAVAKIAGKPLFRLLAERHGTTADPRVFVYAAGGYYYPGKDNDALCAEMRSYLRARLQRREDEDRRREPRRGPHAHRGGAARRSARTRSSPSTPTAGSISRPRSPTPRCCATIRCSGTRRRAIRSTTSCRRRSPSSIRGRWRPARTCSAIRTRATCCATAACAPDRDWLQFDCALSYGLCEYQRTMQAVADAGWSLRRCIPHGGHQMSLNIAAGLGLGGNENYPDLFQPFGGFPDSAVVKDGIVTVPDLPGIGFEGKAALIKAMRDGGVAAAPALAGTSGSCMV